MKPQRIQLSRKKGFDLQAVSIALNGLPAVNCARPSKFGNPFKVGDDYGAGPIDQATAVELFRVDPLCEPKRKQAKAELLGKNLACFCDPGQPCHCDVLLEIANK